MSKCSYSYFTQVQGQMRILHISKCYVVLHVCNTCKSDIHIELVSFDQYFYEKHLDKLTKFYNHFMVPEIVYPSVKFDLPVLDISFRGMCAQFCSNLYLSVTKSLLTCNMVLAWKCVPVIKYQLFNIIDVFIFLKCLQMQSL